MTARSFLTALVISATFPALAEDAVSPLDPAPIETLGTVLVHGTQPAPGLWTATRDGKQILLMATLAPTPKGISWSSPEVMKRIASVQEIIDAPGVRVSADIGPLRGALLWPAYRKSQRNPDSQTLRDVLSPELYARWQVAKNLYLTGDRSVEYLRPVHAARRLFEAAVSRHGLSNEDIVAPAVHQIAKKHSIPVKQTLHPLVIREPREALKALSQTSLEDTQCMQQTLDRLDTDIEQMAVRGNLWAEGDVDALLSSPFVDQKSACIAAFAASALARAEGIEDLDAQVRQSWLTAVYASLANHDLVFAMVPLDRLEGEKGVLATLRAAGFEVQDP